LRDYAFSESERARRLELVERFRPGRISDELADAVFYSCLYEGEMEEMEEGEVDWLEEEREEMKVKRVKGEWPWLWRMLRWGYPPGWVAATGK
jgi:hypothetical protein